MTTTIATKPTLFATREQYIALVEKAGADWAEQSGFIRVNSQSGARLYVAATKTVRRVDLSGFTMPLAEEITKLPHCGKFGKVEQQMVVGSGAEGDLERFEEILTALLALPVPAKPEPKPKAPKKAKGEKKGWGAKPAAPAVEDLAAKAARLALIKRVAAEKGVQVSAQADKE
jgi:hypothetical protein